MKKKSILVLSILYLVVVAHTARSQGDTVQYRLLKSRLGDSSIIRYELGSIAIKKGGNVEFIDFAFDTATILETYYKSKAFNRSNSSDSISIFRFASFDDKFEIPDTPVDTPSAGFETFKSAIADRYVDTVFYVSPNATYFGVNSTIDYIVELRKVSNDNVEARIDTLRCYLSSNGRLKYTHKPSSYPSMVTKVLLTTTIDTPVYLGVKRVASLPTNSTIEDFSGFHAVNRGVDQDVRTDSGFSILPEDLENPPPPPVAKIKNPIKVTELSIYPTPATDKFYISFFAEKEGEVVISLYSSNGQQIYNQYYIAKSGTNTILINVSTLEAGRYEVGLTSGKKTSVKKQLIIK